MDTEKISNRFSDIKVIPGNGYSPYTGSLIFQCYDSYLNANVTVKASDGIKNKHKTIKQEYNFIKQLKHRCIIEVLEYSFENDVEYMVMKGINFGGGRRERWKKIFLTFDKDMTIIFFRSFMDVLFYLQKNNVLHEDIECANILYNPMTVEPILIDFGRSSYKTYSKKWLVNQLCLGQNTKQNAFFREITNSGGVYATEPVHFKFDIRPIVKEIMYERINK